MINRTHPPEEAAICAGSCRSLRTGLFTATLNRLPAERRADYMRAHGFAFLAASPRPENVVTFRMRKTPAPPAA